MNPVRRTSLSLITFAALAAFASSAGCSKGDLDAAKVSETAQSGLHGHLFGISQAIELTARAPFWADLDRSLELGPGACVEPCDTPVITDPDDAAEFADELVEHFFHPDLVESEDGDEVIYLLGGTRVCGGSDRDCLDFFAHADIRLVVTEPAEGELDIAVHVGDAHLQPISFHLSPNSVSAAIDLGVAREVLALYAEYLDLDEGELPRVAAGRITLAMDRNADNDYTVWASVNQRVEVASTVDGSDYNVSIETSSRPVASFRIDGNADQIHSELAFSAVDVSIGFNALAEMFRTCEVVSPPGQPLVTECETPTLHGTLSAHLAGATGGAILDAAARRFEVIGLGLGGDTSRLSLDGNDLATIDVNANSGRVFDVVITGADDGLDIAVTPSMKIDTSLAFQLLVGQIENIDTWTLSDQSSVTLDGAATPALRIPYDRPATGPEVLFSIGSGQAAFASTNIPATVSASAGQCILAGETMLDDGKHPFSALMSASCP